MRVLHILENLDDDNAGSYATGVILGLQQIGVEQYAVIDSRSPHRAELEKSGIKTLPMIRRTPWQPSRRLWLRSLIDRLQPDVAHCWNRKSARLVPAGKRPIIGWLAGHDNPGRFVRCTHFVSANPDNAVRIAANSASGASAKFIPAFSGISASPPLDRSSLATPHNAKVLLSLAPLHPASRLDVLLDALGNLPGCWVWFAGEGPLRRALEEKARRNGVLGRVRFVAARTNRGALLRAADLCALTAPDGPNGMIVPESWAAGAPVIASYAAGGAEPLEDGVTGLLARTGDEKAFAGSVRRALDDGALRRRLIAKGYAAYLGTYAREAVIRQWAELYRKIGIGGYGLGIHDTTN